MNLTGPNKTLVINVNKWYDKFMKKKICLALACALIISFTGCAKTFSLTNEEENLVAEYSSYVLLKHSKQNSSLLLSRDDLKKAIERKEEQDKLVAERRAARGQSTPSSSSSEGSSSAESSSSASSSSGMMQPTNSTVSMTEAVGVSGVEFEYKGYEVTDYIQGSAFSVNASLGKKLVVMNFTASNTKDEDVVCDLKSSKTKFKGYFNGNTIGALATAFLPNDIASFDKNTKLSAKQKLDCVLVFDVPKSLAESLTDVKLSVTKEGAGAASGVSI